MVQLRLQHTAQAKPQARRAAGACVLETVIAIAVIVVLGLSSAFANQVSEHAQGIIAKLAEQHNRRLATADSNTRQRDEAEIEERVMELIRQMRASGADKALSHDIGTNTREIWLKSVRNKGDSIVIDGMAIAPEAVGEVISDLRGSGYFTNIEIKESYQDDSKNKTHAFTFQLTCDVDPGRS